MLTSRKPLKHYAPWLWPFASASQDWPVTGSSDICDWHSALRLRPFSAIFLVYYRRRLHISLFSCHSNFKFPPSLPLFNEHLICSRSLFLFSLIFQVVRTYQRWWPPFNNEGWQMRCTYALFSRSHGFSSFRRAWGCLVQGPLRLGCAM